MDGLQTGLDDDLPRLVTGGDEADPREVFVPVFDGLNDENDGTATADADVAGGGIEMIFDGLAGGGFFGLFDWIGHWIRREGSTDWTSVPGKKGSKWKRCTASWSWSSACAFHRRLQVVCERSRGSG